MRYIVLLVSAFFLLSSAEFAAFLMVNGTGTTGRCYGNIAISSFHNTVQQAINTASAGDTIIVCKNGTSTYHENVTLGKTISFFGNESGVMLEINVPGPRVVTINANFVNMTNFTVSGSSEAGIYVTGSNTRIDHVNVTRNFNGFEFASSSVSKSHTLVGNNVVGNTFAGFYFDGPEGCGYDIIANNTIDNNNLYGIFISLCDFDSILNNSANNEGYGIYFETDSSHANVIRNIANNDTSGFYFAGLTSSFISDNSADNNILHGFVVSSGSSNTLTRNIATNNRRSGFSFFSSTSNKISNNRAFGNGDGFFVSDHSHYNVLASNAAYNNSGSGYRVSNTNETILDSNSAGQNGVSQYSFVNTYRALFTGTTYAMYIPSGATIINISGGGPVTALRGLTYGTIVTNSSNFSFSDAANVTFSRTNVNSVAEGLSETSCSRSGTCKLVSNIVVVSALPSGATIGQLLIYYNQTKIAAPILEENTYLARYDNARSSWIHMGTTSRDTGLNYVRYGPLTASGTYGVIGYSSSGGGTPIPSTPR